MKLIIGLGNPGAKYEKTRHNAGFMALDTLAGTVAWNMSGTCKSEIAEVKIGSTKALLAKPQTFMNDSGDAAGKLARFYKIKKESILVVYDDIDLVVGTLRLRGEGSDGGHRGLRSILQSLKTKNIARLKIGIAENKGGKQRTSSESYVLKAPGKAGSIALKKSLALVPEAVERWLSGEAAATISA